MYTTIDIDYKKTLNGLVFDKWANVQIQAYGALNEPSDQILNNRICYVGINKEFYNIFR